MKTLQLEGSYTVLRITDRAGGQGTLTDQAAPNFTQSPNLLLDVDGIQFTSMLIGELLNVHRAFSDHWEGTAVLVGLVNVSDTSRQVLQRVRLDTMFTLFDSVHAAMHAPPPPVRKSGTA